MFKSALCRDIFHAFAISTLFMICHTATPDAAIIIAIIIMLALPPPLLLRQHSGAMLPYACLSP